MPKTNQEINAEIADLETQINAAFTAGDKDTFDALSAQKVELEKELAEANKPAPTAPAPVEQVSTTMVEKADLTKAVTAVVKPVLKNTRGQDVPVEDYFFAKEGEQAMAPSFFNKAVGFPVGPDREDLIAMFDKVFKPEDNFVLLKDAYKEVYGILVPLKYSDIGSKEDSILGDYQVHAISFIPDGSVNPDKFASALQKVATITNYSSR